MKKVEYETKEGNAGHKFVLEPEDKVVCKYDTPRESKLGKYKNYSLGVEPVTCKVNIYFQDRGEDGKTTMTPKGEGEDTVEFVQLTKAQYEKLEKIGALTGKTVEAYHYSNDFGDQVGVRVAE